MSENNGDLCAALRELAAEMRGQRETVSRLEKTVNRFVVAMERQLASGEAVRRRAERVLAGYDPVEVKAMNDQITKRLAKR